MKKLTAVLFGLALVLVILPPVDPVSAAVSGCKLNLNKTDDSIVSCRVTNRSTQNIITNSNTTIISNQNTLNITGQNYQVAGDDIKKGIINTGKSNIKLRNYFNISNSVIIN